MWSSCWICSVLCQDLLNKQHQIKLFSLVDVHLIPQPINQCHFSAKRLILTIPIRPPAILSKCCKSSIIGCERCVNKWYSGTEALTKTCPSCRAERGYCDTEGSRRASSGGQKVIEAGNESNGDNESNGNGDDLPIVLP